MYVIALRVWKDSCRRADVHMHSTCLSASYSTHAPRDAQQAISNSMTDAQAKLTLLTGAHNSTGCNYPGPRTQQHHKPPAFALTLCTLQMRTKKTNPGVCCTKRKFAGH